MKIMDGTIMPFRRLVVFFFLKGLVVFCTTLVCLFRLK